MNPAIARSVLAALVALLLAGWFLLAAGWIRSGRATFSVSLAGGADGWSALARARRDPGGVLFVEVLLDHTSGLPRTFAWEVALPGQGVTCRGIARLPQAGLHDAGLPECRARWTGSRGALLARASSAWVAIVWFDGTLREARFPLGPGRSP